MTPLPDPAPDPAPETLARLTLTLRSDVAALRGLAVLEDHGAHLVLRTPAQPDYWSGNALLVPGPPGDPGRERALFRAAFPEARHETIDWSVPDLDPAPVRAAWAPLGFEVGHVDALTATGALPPAEAPPGYALRELASDADWDAALALQLATALEDDPVPDAGAHAPYLRRRIAGWRAQAAWGFARFWGAFEDGSGGDALAAMLGLVAGGPALGRLARFQEVATARTHRRRGLCAALLARAAAAALARDPRTRLVIVADAGGPAGRLYRRAGLALAERAVGAIRAGR